MTGPVDERDVRLQARLPAVAEIICFVRDLDPDGVKTWCADQGITDRATQELIVLLAAMVPDDRPPHDLLAWTQTAPAPRTRHAAPMLVLWPGAVARSFLPGLHQAVGAVLQVHQLHAHLPGARRLRAPGGAEERRVTAARAP